MQKKGYLSYWQTIWRNFKRHWLGLIALCVVSLFALVGIYAPFLASSKPLIVYYNGDWYFPLFRYLFYTGFYTKPIDIFFNLLIFTFPAILIAWILLEKPFRGLVVLFFAAAQFGLFFYIILTPPKDPAADDPVKAFERHEIMLHNPNPNWSQELEFMNDYAKLNLLLRERQWHAQYHRLLPYAKSYADYAAVRGKDETLPVLWAAERKREKTDVEALKKQLAFGTLSSSDREYNQSKIKYILERREWLNENVKRLHFIVMPLIRDLHWQDDAGGEQSLNQFIPWYELTRINRKDLVAALIFGVRISLVVGILGVSIALSIGVPIGAFAGYYGGTLDILVCRMLEIWEAMPIFFMLLLVVAIAQSKSIFLIIFVIGIFGWTSFSRYIRGEFFKQRNLSYVEACRSLGFRDSFIMFSHIMPNAIPPLLTLMPFAIMGAISSEAGLSFLGLGEEGSCSWGVLMDEGRNAFPGESYLLWPPAILLTTLLVAIALVGDALRDALDPKLHI